MSKYGFGKIVDLSFDDAIEHVTHALQAEGFGVLADTDIAGAMKKKLRTCRLTGSWAHAIRHWRIAPWNASHPSVCFCPATSGAAGRRQHGPC